MRTHLNDVILQSPAIQELGQFIRSRDQAWADGQIPDLEAFESELRERLAAIGQELTERELARYDVEAEEVQVGGMTYHRELTSSETYLSATGPVSVTRHLYRPPGRHSRCICPLELRAGIIAGWFTPQAARQAAFAVAHLQPQVAEALFDEIGMMQPSRSSLERLPKELSSHWEAHRQEWEALLRDMETVPRSAAVLAVSLDGVLAPMKPEGGQPVQTSQVSDKQPKGPTGFREVGCGTVSLYDQDGERLHTVRYGRMPESHKATLCQQLEAECQSILALHPGLTVVKLADGAAHNWSFLSQLDLGSHMPHGTQLEIVDFYHACNHLKTACDAIWGEFSPHGKAEFERLKTLLNEADDGVTKVIRSLKYRVRRTRGTRRKRINTELTYFRNQRHRMAYAQYQRDHLPIASGVVEAACKTLVTQRLKLSGMRWSTKGGQAILTLRSLVQSNRWEHGWALLSYDFRKQVQAVKTKSNYWPIPLAA